MASAWPASPSHPSNSPTTVPEGFKNASSKIDTGKVLVACFSATGNTQAVAEVLAAHLEADYFGIEPVDRYTAKGLDYGDETSRATAEQSDVSARPALAVIPDLSPYDIVVLGHPIWWGKAPRLMCTFLESVDVSGKRLAEFCTSESSGVEGAADELKEISADAKWIGVKRFAVGASDGEVAAWADSLRIR